MTVFNVQNLSKSFGSLQVLSNISVNVKEGEVVALVGPNGSGKSTLFNLVSGLLKCDSGRVLFNGRNITGLKPHVIARAGIARTFQTPRPLTNMTVFENVSLANLNNANSMTPQKVSDILEQCFLSEVANSDAGDLGFTKLRFLELARAIAMRPKLLLADELLSGLNEQEVDLASRSMVKMKEEFRTATLISGHFVRHLVKIAERFIVLSSGTIIAEGSFDEVSNNPKVVEAYLGVPNAGNK